MASFTGTLNIKLITLELDEAKSVELFVSVDQSPVYQTSAKNSHINEPFASKIQDGKEIQFAVFNELPKSPDDLVATGIVSFDEILKKQKKDGVFEMQVGLPNEFSIESLAYLKSIDYNPLDNQTIQTYLD